MSYDPNDWSHMSSDWLKGSAHSWLVMALCDSVLALFGLAFALQSLFHRELVGLGFLLVAGLIGKIAFDCFRTRTVRLRALRIREASHA